VWWGSGAYDLLLIIKRVVQGEEQDREAVNDDQRVCEALPVVGLQVDLILGTPTEICIRGDAVGGLIVSARPAKLPSDRDLGALELGVVSCTGACVAEFVLILLDCLC
jgi:hypothetical protein